MKMPFRILTPYPPRVKFTNNMHAVLENSRINTLEEFERLEPIEESPAPPKLNYYRNSVWEGESKPNDYSVEKFLETEETASRSEELRSGQARVTSDLPVRDMWDINWANIKDWIHNWRVVPLNERLLIKAVLTSSLEGNANRNGLKTFNLGSHLLQAIGTDLTNIVGNGTCAVRSNLMYEGSYYHNDCLNNRVLDPKTSRRAFSAYMKENNIEKLYQEGYSSFHAVVNSGEDLRWLRGQTSAYGDRLWSFYQENVKKFRWLKGQGLVDYYIYSHEMSSRNLLEKEFNPHTHVMFFLPRTGLGPDDDQWRAREIAREFNLSGAQGVMSPDTELNGGSREIRFQTKWGSSVRGSIGYYFRAYSTVGNYLKEIRPDNIRELNLATREYSRTVDELMSGKHRRIFGGTRMPKKPKE